MKLFALSALLLLAGCGHKASCPTEFYDEYRELDDCSHTAGCTLTPKQTKQLDKERIACKDGATGEEGDLSK